MTAEDAIESLLCREGIACVVALTWVDGDGAIQLVDPVDPPPSCTRQGIKTTAALVVCSTLHAEDSLVEAQPEKDKNNVSANVYYAPVIGGWGPFWA